MKAQELKDKFNYCMHGLGAFAGVRQTNTKEAFLRWYKKGVKVFEKPDIYAYDWFMKQTLFSPDFFLKIMVCYSHTGNTIQCAGI